MSKIISFGAGVQSTALLALACRKEIDFSTFVFCNVGDDSENPLTLLYYREILVPYVKRYSHVNIQEVQRTRNGKPDTILTQLKSANKSIGIPVYMSNGAPSNRSCTVDYKITVVDQWLRKYGDGCHHIVGLGISLDEFQRCTTRYNTEKKTLVYPLIDLRLTRQDCLRIIQEDGLPVPPKSSCWFCPFHSIRTWQEMREKDPEQFQRAIELEQFINKRREELGKDHVWLSRKLKPLMQATTELYQHSFIDDDLCDSGYCFT